jgi:hypothetical protein
MAPMIRSACARAAQLTTAVALMSGCAGGVAGWHRVPEPIPPAFAPRQQVQVWQDGRNVLWHGVEVRGNSLTGIPFQQPLSCASCRRNLPLAAVDSLRSGNMERVGWLMVASPWLLGAACLLYLGLTGSGGWES